MRYDNLHGDEDEVELTSDEIYELECQMADQMNDDAWLAGDREISHNLTRIENE